MPRRTEFHVQFLLHEREIMKKCKVTSAVLKKLDLLDPDAGIASVQLTPVDLDWLVSDLNHAIVKRGCNDLDTFEFSERMEFVRKTGDGSLIAWY